MASKFTSLEENKEIVDLYRSGQYSFEQIAEMKCLSKGTIINIVKGYPYQDKQKFYSKLQVDSSANFEKAIEEMEQSAQKAYQRKNYLAYGLHLQRWADLIFDTAETDNIYEQLRIKRTSFEQQAWVAFADRRFGEFGYYADTWEILTNILGDNTKNPFSEASIKLNARDKSRNLRFSDLDNKKRAIGTIKDNEHSKIISLPDKIMDKIEVFVPGPQSHNNRDILKYVLLAIQEGKFRRCGKVSKRTINRKFVIWYRAGFFKKLCRLINLYPELQQIRQPLEALERYRITYGNEYIPKLPISSRNTI